jgi:hypothetical protein
MAQRSVFGKPFVKFCDSHGGYESATNVRIGPLIDPAVESKKQRVGAANLVGMNSHIKRCFICDRLLIYFGKAVAHLHEIQACGHFSYDYQVAESECQRLRKRLLQHVNQHDREISVGDSDAIVSRMQIPVGHMQ